MSEDYALEESVKYAWMNLGDTSKLHVVNPFDFREKEDLENIHIYYLKQMRKPENFWFTCKHVLNIHLLPFQVVILQELWKRKYPMLIGSRGMSKSFLLAVYSLLRALFFQGCKVVLVGAAFRQSKIIFEYCEQIWRNAPVLRDLAGSDSGPHHDPDRWSFTIGFSQINALPVGDGTTIRGQRANTIICDEFSSINPEVYENVISGFAAVSQNPVDEVMNAASIARLKEIGDWSPEEELAEAERNKGNQAIVSGTAYYGFNHFSDYWKKYKNIIESRGDINKIKNLSSNNETDKNLNWKDYAIIRIPYDILPKGFLDEAHISRSKATVNTGQHAIEYGAVFSVDSCGFFKRTLIESCVTKEPIIFPGGRSVKFHAHISGHPDRKYIYGVDPASESDNFSIVVLEVHPEHRRIVYCWTTTRDRYKDKLSRGLTSEQNFYHYCARKIRDLMPIFPCLKIALDKQGGGITIEETLHDTDKMVSGEYPIWPEQIMGEPQPTDTYHGLHILNLINFSDSKWVSEANHGMRKDFEDKILLFPYFDSISLFYAEKDDTNKSRASDTLEDCVMEIEELKDELATIEHTQTSIAGRDRWDVPQIKKPGGKKGRLRKDRYSALLMANMLARQLQRKPNEPVYEGAGGFAQHIARSVDRDNISGAVYIGPAWVNEGIGDASNYGAVIRRGQSR
jgi:hypothetical protein